MSIMAKYNIWRPRGEIIIITTQDREDCGRPPLATLDTTGLPDDDAEEVFGELERLIYVANLYNDIDHHISTLLTGLLDVVKQKDSIADGAPLLVAYNMAIIAQNALETLRSESGRAHPLLKLVKAR